MKRLHHLRHRIHHHIRHHVRHHVLPASKIIFWFGIGACIGLLFVMSFLYMMYQNTYKNKVYPGVTIDNVDMSGKTQAQVHSFFAQKNKRIGPVKITFISGDLAATTSAQALQMGYNADLLSTQAISIGRSSDIISNVSTLLQTYIYGVHLPATYQNDSRVLKNTLGPLSKDITKSPVNAQFVISNDRVTTFQISQDGKSIDEDKLSTQLSDITAQLVKTPSIVSITLPLPIKTIKPQVTTDKINTYGIKELVATGTSLFAGSIPSRVYNIGLAASRIDGALVAPGEVFSFDKTVGDISAFSGYKQAYVISNGHTVLGDGGGVCQVSTTLFRALLNAGLPIVERHAHAYEVHYYTEDAPLGLDAAIYSPDVDLKFKNDTDHYILIRSLFDPDEQRLTFELYGTKDDRQVTISQPVITGQTPAPDPLYVDDPTRPKGYLEQTDFAAPGANVSFTRTVMKDGKTIIADKFTSNFRPWQAVYIRGTM